MNEAKFLKLNITRAADLEENGVVDLQHLDIFSKVLTFHLIKFKIAEL